MRVLIVSLSFLALPAVAHAQPVENTPSLCQNQVDDDGDGLVDCADDGCSRLIFCVDYQPEEQGEDQCGNGADDDGDGRADCQDDGCAEVCGAAQPAGRGQPGTQGIYQPRVVEQGPDVGYLEHESERNYAYGYAERPMTYLEGMLVPQLGVSAFNLGAVLGTTSVFTFLGAGVSYGATDFLQISVIPVAARLTTDPAEFGSPALGLRLRFFSEDVVELGLYANATLPLTTGNGATSYSAALPVGLDSFAERSRETGSTGVDAALALRLRFADLVRIDLTLPQVTMFFGEDPAGALDVRVNLLFDLDVGFSITDYAFAGVSSGFYGLDVEDMQPFVPLGFFAGAVIPGPSRRGPLGDVTLRFGWPIFANLDPGPADAIDPDAWQISADVRVFTYLLP